MRRVWVVLISLALLVASPGLADADAYTRPAGNQKYIDALIARGLSQRGVPFAYGGGNANGPSLGNPSSPDPAPAAAIPGSTAPLLPAAPVVPAAPQVAAPGLLGSPTVPAAPVQQIVGFDASGLMVYSYAGVGVKLPRTSGEQYNAGQKVLPAQALPGDLIFYGPDGSQSVAMFLGNSQMLETTDTGVTVSPVRTNNMAPYLVRIIQ
ncbi:NlpC/P60 family peptidoglycan-binding protein RipD [Mycolicibacterium komossense]|uniref:NlpC/P60 family peptidoglycan-binding protein RipD n=1 Tax=Mycolicibacterium komossense TaxID=1779 RepID=A0ABT3CAP6_9MYCO|nr:NlpC/P60 family peptidoglycan-binding protein RipD [Mycolicibacterium komossense]MCV7226554.1 NlpC/P60 family peptidoglycan-binding protein RipD [Mycolicibacterium komossense]